MVAGSAATDAALVTLLLEPGFDLCRPVGAVGPHRVAGVGLVEHLIELLAVVDRGIRLGIAADELVLAVNDDVVLVAVEAFLVLLAPARILILLRILGQMLLPPFRRLADFDRLILLTPVVLLGRTHNRGIDNLTAPRDVALGSKVPVEVRRQRLDPAGLGQRLAKQPYRRRIRYCVLQTKA